MSEAALTGLCLLVFIGGWYFFDWIGKRNKNKH
jgi:hypothetical protein